MKHILFLIICLMLVSIAKSQTVSEDTMPVYHSARIMISSNFTLKDAEQNGIELEHAIIKNGEWIETVISNATLKRLRSQGVTATILIDNLTEFYTARNTASFSKQRPELLNTPKNFSLGSNGGYFSLQEIYNNFQKMRTFAPQTVSDSIIIGSSFEKRSLYAYRFGNNTSDTMPQVLFTALHHAREPGSASTLVYFLWKLLEDAANGNQEANYLLNNRIIYVVPVVNPDGYLYNERNGFGALWRKNRRDNKDGTYGVDLNRNYGPLQYWNSPDGGSSEKTYDDTYRGTAPFSEPETQAVSNFVLKHNFNTCVNYHTFSNVIIYPFGCVNKESADSAFFRAFSAEASKFNKYSAGRDIQTVGYSTRGVSDDWMYTIEGAKQQRTYSFTSEVGTRLDGFYAPKERIISQCDENLYFNYQTVWSADVNYRITDVRTRIGPVTNHSTLTVVVQNIGLTTPTNDYSLVLNSLDTRLLISENHQSISPLSTAQLASITFDAQVNDTYPNGDISMVEYILTQDGVERRDTLRLQFNRPTRLVLYDNSRSDSMWEEGKWRIIPNPDGEFMITDSPNGNYEDSTSNYLQTKAPINLEHSRNATLEFWTKWSIESNFDFAVVQVSVNNGRTWNYLQTSRMKPASGVNGARQEENSFGFDGNFPTWVRQECSLDAYTGKNILLRFGVLADIHGNFDGMFLRDIAVNSYSDSSTKIPVEPLQNIKLEVFPTPTVRGKNLYAVLSSPKAQLPVGNYQLLLYNMLGEKCYEQSGTTISGNEQVFSIPTTTLSVGAYQLRVEYDGQILTSGCQIMK